MTGPGFMANQAAQRAAQQANFAAQRAAQQAAAQANQAAHQAAETSRAAARHAQEQARWASQQGASRRGARQPPNTAGRPAGGAMGRLVRFVLGLVTLAVVLAVVWLVVGGDPGAFQVLMDRLRR